MNFLLFLGLIGLVGLPFTPLASGWFGLTANGISLWTFLFLMAHVLLVLGYLKHILQPGGGAGALESWARLVYPMGLIIIIQALVALGLIGWPGSLSSGTWWLGLLSTLLIISAVAATRFLKVPPPYIQMPGNSGFGKVLNWALPRLEHIFRLEWAYQLLWWINNAVGVMLRAFSKILEGDGGILWTILFLILLTSLLFGSGAQ